VYSIVYYHTPPYPHTPQGILLESPYTHGLLNANTSIVSHLMTYEHSTPYIRCHKDMCWWRPPPYHHVLHCLGVSVLACLHDEIDRPYNLLRLPHTTRHAAMLWCRQHYACSQPYIVNDVSVVLSFLNPITICYMASKVLSFP